MTQEVAGPAGTRHEDADHGLVRLHDVEVPTRHGPVRIDVFLPWPEAGPVPLIASMSPYGKDLHFTEKDPVIYERIGSHNPSMVYEAPDPVTWTGFGYGLVRIDAPGTGSSPGTIDVFSLRDSEVYADVIEWIAVQSWSSGRVGLLGVSYYSWSQVAVAALRPPHLRCIVPWEVGGDSYRSAYQGGIYNSFFIRSWYDAWVAANQHGRGVLTEEELRAARRDYGEEALAHPLIDGYWADRIADVSRIEVPFLTAANLTGPQLTVRDHIDLFARASSSHRHLRVHSGSHIEPFYSEEGVALQRAFLDRWLRDVEVELPRVSYVLRAPDGERHLVDEEWPPAGTRQEALHLHPDGRLATDEPARGVLVLDAPPDPMMSRLQEAAGSSDGHRAVHLDPGFLATYQAEATIEHARPQPWRVLLTSDPLEADLAVVGPLVLDLLVSATEEDGDLFVAVRHLDEQGEEITYVGVDNPETPLALGWLRLSHAEEDVELTRPDWPVHAHRRLRPLVPGEPRRVRIAVGPTSALLRAGHRLRLEISSRDPLGSFPFLHVTPGDRRFGGSLSVHTGPEGTRLMVPVSPHHG